MNINYSTFTENGHVACGVCSVDENQYLTKMVERTRIEKRGAKFKSGANTASIQGKAK